MESTDPGTPSFEYLQDTPTKALQKKATVNENTKEEEEIKGLFVFSFYVPGDTFDIQNNIYVQGISMYINAIQKPGGVFRNWKVLLYTDEPSYELVKNHFPGKSVEYCIVKWPYYTTTDGKIHGGIQRVMRFRSFFDFPTIPVFVRDADTVFADDRKRVLIKKDVYEWEANFLRGALKHPNTWIFGTSLLYYLAHHKNHNKKLYSPLGPFAGFQSLMPTVSCFQSEDLWTEAIDYIKDDTARTGNNTFSNKNDFYKRTGKDERILSFVFLQKCGIENVFFFELDLASFRKVALKGKIFLEDDYPSFIFKRGSNTKIQEIFDQAIKNDFTKNRYNEIRGQRIKIETELQNFNSKRSKNIEKFMIGFPNKGIELRDPRFTSIGMRFFYSEIYHVYSKLMGILDNEKKTQLQGAYDNFIKENKKYERAMRDIEDKLAYSNTVNLPPTEKAAYQQIVEEKDKAAKNFVDTVLSMYSKDEILKMVDYMRREDVEVLLDFYRKPAPPPPPPPQTLSRFKFLKPDEQVKRVTLSTLLGPKKGGTRKKRRTTKKLKSRKGKAKAY